MQYLEIFSIAFPLGLLLLSTAISRWAGQKKTPRARAAAEIMNIPEEDEMDRAIESKVMRLVFNCMTELLYCSSRTRSETPLYSSSPLVRIAGLTLVLGFAALLIFRLPAMGGG